MRLLWDFFIMDMCGQSSQETSLCSPQESLDHRPGLENVSGILLVGIATDCEMCAEVCENLLVDEDNMMDVRSKSGDGRSIPTGMIPKPLIFLMARMESTEESLIKKTRMTGSMKT